MLRRFKFTNKFLELFLELLRRYIALLNSVHIRFDDRKQVIDMNNEIIPKLSMLSFGDYIKNYIKGLDYF